MRTRYRNNNNHKKTPLSYFLSITFLCLSCFSVLTWSDGDVDKGFTALRNGDFATALRELTPLAEQGDAYAQTYLGSMYKQGQGVPQDYKTAVKWYTLAAEQGHATAQTLLGLGYYYGEGVIQDNVYAHMWGNIAGSNGSEGGVKLRDTVAERMTPADISNAQRLARECVQKNHKDC